MELTWEEPPAEAFISQPAGFFGQLATLLRKRPHEWAVVPRVYASEESAQQAARNIASGRIKAMPKGMFEARSHDKTIWARFHPADDEGIEPQPGGDNVRPIRSDTAKVREWAESQGITVAKHGRLPKELIARYEEWLDAQDGQGEQP